ncbi:MAG: hypothetical protein ACI9DJ_002049 [Algoriphagus sp.]|jgi:hypothetical protein
MKNAVKIIAGLLFISTMVSATNRVPEEETKKEKPFKMSMYFDKVSGVVNTFYEKQRGENLIVRVIDKEGNELSKNAIGKKSEVAKLSLNVSGLENGIYSIKVSDGNETITKTIRVEKSTPIKTKNFNMQIIQA